MKLRRAMAVAAATAVIAPVVLGAGAMFVVRRRRNGDAAA